MQPFYKREMLGLVSFLLLFLLGSKKATLQKREKKKKKKKKLPQKTDLRSRLSWDICYELKEA